MRCDANISSPLWTRRVRYESRIEKLELFIFREKGLAFEEKRQAKVLLSGGEINKKHAVLTKQRIKQF